MTDGVHCLREKDLGTLRSDIQILIGESRQSDKRINKLESKLDDVSTISTAISVMSLSLEHIVEHNHRQDDMMRNQNKTLENMNENLNRLNQGQNSLEQKVEKLEVRVDNNETLNTVDLRGINKDKQESYLKKYAGPITLGIAIGGILVQIVLASK